MDGVILTPLKQIFNAKGDIFHAMKKSDNGFSGFGEAYFSTINQNEIKGWKKHFRMTLNIIVIIGEIKFVIYNEIKNTFFTVKLSNKNYKRLTVEPGLCVAFKGCKQKNILLNLANLEHDPKESYNIELDKISYKWEIS